MSSAVANHAMLSGRSKNVFASRTPSLFTVTSCAAGSENRNACYDCCTTTKNSCQEACPEGDSNYACRQLCSETYVLKPFPFSLFFGGGVIWSLPINGKPRLVVSVCGTGTLCAPRVWAAGGRRSRVATMHEPHGPSFCLIPIKKKVVPLQLFSMPSFKWQSTTASRVFALFA